jgi:hypothetical protein
VHEHAVCERHAAEPDLVFRHEKRLAPVELAAI